MNGRTKKTKVAKVQIQNWLPERGNTKIIQAKNKRIKNANTTGIDNNSSLSNVWCFWKAFASFCDTAKMARPLFILQKTLKPAS